MRATPSIANLTSMTATIATQVGATRTAAKYGMNAIDPRAFLAKTKESISASTAKAEKKGNRNQLISRGRRELPRQNRHRPYGGSGHSDDVSLGIKTHKKIE